MSRFSFWTGVAAGAIADHVIESHRGSEQQPESSQSVSTSCFGTGLDLYAGSRMDEPRGRMVDEYLDMLMSDKHSPAPEAADNKHYALSAQYWRESDKTTSIPDKGMATLNKLIEFDEKTYGKDSMNVKDDFSELGDRLFEKHDFTNAANAYHRTDKFESEEKAIGEAKISKLWNEKNYPAAIMARLQLIQVLDLPSLPRIEFHF